MRERYIGLRSLAVVGLVCGLDAVARAQEAAPPSLLPGAADLIEWNDALARPPTWPATRPRPQERCLVGDPRGPDAVPQTHWIATNTQGRCQDLGASGGNWRSRFLFTVPRKLLGQSFATDLTYCLYRWESGGCVADPGPMLRLRAQLDPPVMVPQQVSEAALASAWTKPLYELAQARLAVPSRGQRGPQRGRVRVAVIDTASGSHYGRYVDPTGHGRTVARWIEDVACGALKPAGDGARTGSVLAGQCGTQIVYDRALSLTRTGGAAYGTPGMVAESIERVSQAWWETEGRSGRSRLVINLSVGWSAAWESGGDLGGLPRFMDQALQRAGCRGAVIVAAGGNSDAVDGKPFDAPESDFPNHLPNDRLTFPGLGAGRAVTRELCRMWGIESPTLGPNNTVSTVLIGVGAVDEGDRRLATAQNDMTLMAYGSSIPVPDGAGWMQALSGTSMSAAGVTGIVAAMLSADPTLDTSRVARLLLESAVPLRSGVVPETGRREDFRGWSLNNRTPGLLRPSELDWVRRASYCGAMASLGVRLDCTTPRVAAGTEAVAFGTVSGISPDSVTAFDCDACAASDTSDDCLACTIEATDPDWAEQPWAGPQPPGKACKSCALVLAPRSAPTLEILELDAEIRPTMNDLLVEGRRRDGMTVRALVSRRPPPEQLTAVLPASFSSVVSVRVKYHPPGSVSIDDTDAWYVQAIPISRVSLLAD